MLEWVRQDVLDGIMKSKRKIGKERIMASRALKIDPTKSGTSHQADSTEPNVAQTVDENAIAALAFQLWQERGCPIGSDQQDWFRAEQELQGEPDQSQRRRS